jgi:hypothetical protein
MDAANIIAYVGGGLSIASIVLGIINHKQLVSDCCSRKFRVALDVSSTENNIVPLLTEANATRT